MLEGYVDIEDANLILNGFEHGFRLQYIGPRIKRTSKNLLSALSYKLETEEKLLNEVKLGRMLGPFNKCPISNLQTSPIGLVPKENSGWRLITHLSYPEGSSINDFIDYDICQVKYTSVDKVLEIVTSCGRHARIGKMDISQAFRLLVINPADFDLLGIEFDGKFYIDKCLPFGLSLSCSLFEKFAKMLHWAVVNQSSIDTLDHYLDDFIFIGPSDSDNCSVLMHTFSKICDTIGVPINDEKTVGPTTLLTFLGLDIDTVTMTLRIPIEKLERLKTKLSPLLSVKKVILRDLESVIGLMAFCSKAIPSSRAFLRRFYDLLASVKNKKPFYYVRVNNEVKEDVKLWLKFLKSFNGTVIIPEQFWLSNEAIELFTDSSGNPLLGCGTYFAGHWAQFKWPDIWLHSKVFSDMTFLEFIPVLLAMFIWAETLQNKKN